MFINFLFISSGKTIINADKGNGIPKNEVTGGFASEVIEYRVLLKKQKESWFVRIVDELYPE
jgi:hypothetical protein